MAFTISRSQSALTEGEKENVDKLGYNKECGAGKESMISSQLQLKSSLSSSQSLDKHAVLRRIRQRRSYNRAKSALKALMGPSEATSQEHKWLQLGDSFSSP
ncbi:uncharacterized protein LOC109789557 [Cajanus cajan]|uniref:Uncharacterized protein n=1 Tax=Cajanus cajan TaxID=3821 RepID=A0A151R6R3_CAJCA|nr:uncharacterized protein LOC109789557 [Cajanus cajan]KYP38231.1 hypothetical protein KK1_040525 [Cajanus cajan]